jgi:hypothetical protein
MSDKTSTIDKPNPTMAATSPGDAAVMAALEGKPPPTVENSDALAKGDLSPGTMDDGKQAVANGGQQSPQSALNKTDGPPPKDDGDDDEDDDKDGEKGCGGKKSITDDELSKALDVALAHAEGREVPDVDRQAELVEKLSKGELDDAEREELMGILSKGADAGGQGEGEGEGEDESADELRRSYSEMAQDDPDIASPTAGDDGSVDVAAFLQRFAAFMGGSLDEVASTVEKGFGRVHGFNGALVKGLQVMSQRQHAQAEVIQKQGALIKALTDRVEIFGKTPQGRRSVATVTQAEQLQRGFGPTNEGQELTKDEMVKSLVQMNRESKDGKSPGGYDLTFATAHLESNQPLPDGLINEIRKSLGK